jgi:four helix bundle protein
LATSNATYACNLLAHKGFPREEAYGLCGQLRRSAVSIPSNIAEGQARLSTGEFRQFLGIARGSNAELQTQLEIARDLGYSEGTTMLGLSIEVGKMINAILQSLNTQPLTTNH